MVILANSITAIKLQSQTNRIMLRASVLFVLRRPSIVFAVVTLCAIYLLFRDAPTLSLLPPRPLRSLLFQLDRNTNTKWRPVRRSEMDWSRPRVGIGMAMRQLRAYLQAGEAVTEADAFWRDLYEKELVEWALPDGVRSAVEYENGLVKNAQCVAITGGAMSFQRVVLNFKILREFHKHLPIHIYHTNRDQFDTLQVKMLTDLNDNHGPVLLNTLFKDDAILNTAQTDKLFAVMACPCEHVLLIDQDVILFSDPTVYFMSDSYRQHHALFFKDRQLHPNNDGLVSFLLDRLLLQPVSPSLSQQNFIFNLKSSFQQDSSLLLLHKTDYRWLGIIHAMALASPPVRVAWSNQFQGDKETWWMAYESCGLSYWFEPNDPASIGIPLDQDGQPAVCGGKLLHYFDGKAVWASGGVDGSAQEGMRVEMITAVSDGKGKWTLGLCQLGPVHDTQWWGIAQGMERIHRLYQADPLQTK